MIDMQTLGLAARGLYNHARHGVSPKAQYECALALMAQTNGGAADVINLAHRAFVSRQRYGATRGALGQMSARDRASVVRSIKQAGFFVFPDRIPEAAIEPIDAMMSTAEGLYYPTPGGPPKRAVYDPNAPLAPAYYYSGQFPAALQRLMVDETFAAIATDYLGVDPILHTCLQWISARAVAPSSPVAQMYHFDVSSLKWLSLFVYLTDVSPDTGPHCMIKGSHRFRDRASAPLRAKGVVRFTDEEIAVAYGQERHVEISGKRGTVLLVDTRACHKGKHPVAGDRRIMQLVYVNSTFGVPGKYEPVTSPIPEYVAANNRWPRLLEYHRPVTR